MQMQETAALLDRSERVRDGLDRLLADLQDIETGARGYVITGDPSYLEPFEASLGKVNGQFESLRKLTADNPRQQAGCDTLGLLISRRIIAAQGVVDLRRDTNFEEARKEVSKGTGKAVMNQIRSVIGRMDAEEQALLDERSAATRQATGSNLVFMLTGTGLSFTLLITVFALVLRENRLRLRAEEHIAANLDALADFKAALDAHAIVAITDAKGKITYVNDKFCAISKYAREELIGQDHRIINSGHHPKAFIRGLWETIVGGRMWKGEIKNRAKDGSFYWVDTTIVPFLDEQGKPVQFIAIRADITGRKLTEEALRQSEERMRLAAEAAGIGVWDWDIKTGKVQWDERMFGLYGLPVAPDGLAAYAAWRAAVLPADIAEQEAVLQRTVATGSRSQREFRIVRAPDNAVRVILAAEIAIPGTDGQTAHVVGINLDITERKEAEEKIARLNADLQHRAAQLEGANKELESFSYSVSHDLRAPLRHVQGYVQMLAAATEGQLSDKALRYLKTINDASVEMGQLIDDLLAFSRMGRAEMSEDSVEPDILMKETLRGLEMAVQGRNIEWKIAPLPGVVGDRAMIRQVLVNLVGNAVKYTRQRDPARIEIGCEGEKDGRFIFFVRDNGAGFDMQYAHKLFGVFQRLHRADEFEGTGIGLATVRRIISRHGGRVWAEGKVGEGAAFYFTLQPAATA